MKYFIVIYFMSWITIWEGLPSVRIGLKLANRVRQNLSPRVMYKHTFHLDLCGSRFELHYIWESQLQLNIIKIIWSNTDSFFLSLNVFIYRSQMKIFQKKHLLVFSKYALKHSGLKREMQYIQSVHRKKNNATFFV